MRVEYAVKFVISEHEKLVNMTVKKKALLLHYVCILLISLCQFLIVNKRANKQTRTHIRTTK